MADLPPNELAALDAELAARNDEAPADLILRLVEQLLAHERADATVGIQALLREIEAREPGALAQIQARLERRRMIRDHGPRAVRQ